MQKRSWQFLSTPFLHLVGITVKLISTPYFLKDRSSSFLENSVLSYHGWVLPWYGEYEIDRMVFKV